MKYARAAPINIEYVAALASSVKMIIEFNTVNAISGIKRYTNRFLNSICLILAIAKRNAIAKDANSKDTIFGSNLSNPLDEIEYGKNPSTAIVRYNATTNDVVTES